MASSELGRSLADCGALFAAKKVAKGAKPSAVRCQPSTRGTKPYAVLPLRVAIYPRASTRYARARAKFMRNRFANTCWSTSFRRTTSACPSGSACPAPLSAHTSAQSSLHPPSGSTSAYAVSTARSSFSCASRSHVGRSLYRFVNVRFLNRASRVASSMIADQHSESTAITNLGIAFAELGGPRKAIEYYEQQLTIAREIGDRRGEAIASWNLGSKHAKAGNLADAIDLMQDCVDHEREIGHAFANQDAAKVAALRARLAQPPIPPPPPNS